MALLMSTTLCFYWPIRKISTSFCWTKKKDLNLAYVRRYVFGKQKICMSVPKSHSIETIIFSYFSMNTLCCDIHQNCFTEVILKSTKIQIFVKKYENYWIFFFLINASYLESWYVMKGRNISQDNKKRLCMTSKKLPFHNSKKFSLYIIALWYIININIRLRPRSTKMWSPPSIRRKVVSQHGQQMIWCTSRVKINHKLEKVSAVNNLGAQATKKWTDFFTNK